MSDCRVAKKNRSFYVKFKSDRKYPIEKTTPLAVRAAGRVKTAMVRKKRNKKMNELKEAFLECWLDFEKAVLGKLPPPPACKDSVLIVMNSGRFELTNEQFNTLMTLSVVHKAIEIDCGAEVAISAALTQERIDTLKQITAIIEDSK